MLNNQWIRRFGAETEYPYHLFCLPMAGSGATLYKDWQNDLHLKVNVLPIQFPGRENRLHEAVITDAHVLVNEIYDGIKNMLDRPFSIFGHSMGGFLAYELALKIYEEKALCPDILFTSATSLDGRDKPPVSTLSEEALIEYLKNGGGTPPECLALESFRKMYFPVIRGDYQLVENYRSSKKRIPCPVRALACPEDEEVNVRFTEAIANYTDNYKITYFEGGHFYIVDKQPEVCAYIAEVLKGYVA